MIEEEQDLERNQKVRRKEKQKTQKIAQLNQNGQNVINEKDSLSQSNLSDYYDEDENVDPKEKNDKFQNVLEDLKDRNYYEQQIPPDFHLAEKHRRALLVGKEKKVDKENTEELQFCECCNRQVNKIQLEINCPVHDLSFLGAGYTLYFVYLKYCIVLILVTLGSSGLFNMVTNVLNTSCSPAEQQTQSSNKTDTESNVQGCDNNWINSASLGNKIKNQEHMSIQGYMNLLSVGTIIIMLQFFRYSQRVTDQECDDNDVSCQDYTILIKNIPTYYDALNNDYDDDLKIFLEKNALPDEETNIVAVNLCFNLKSLLILKEKIAEYIKTKQEIMIDLQKPEGEKKKYTQQDLIDINDKITSIYKEKEQTSQKLAEGKGKEFMKEYFVGWAFVSLLTETQKELVISQYEPVSFPSCGKVENTLIYQGNKLEIMQAPAPTDIYWDNLHISTKEKIKRRILGFLLSASVLIVCLIIVYIIGNFQIQAKEDKDFSKVQYLSIISSIFVSIANVIMTTSFAFITHFERYSTWTKYYINIAKGISVAQFINTAVIPFILQVFLFDDKYYERIFGVGGLVQNQNNVMIINTFVPNVVAFLDPDFITKKLLRKKESLNQEQSVLTQIQLNEVFEDPEFNISQRYAELMNSLFSTAFYSSIIPVGLFYSLLNVFMHYWVDKYTLLRRKVVKSSLSVDLSIEMTEQLEYFLPIYTVSSMIFYYYATGGDIPPLSYVLSAILGVVHCFLPMQELNEIIFKIDKGEPNSDDYEKASELFTSTYPSENPVTKERAQLEKQREIFEHIMQQKMNNNLKKQALFDIIQTNINNQPGKNTEIVEKQVVQKEEKEEKLGEIPQNKESNAQNPKKQFALLTIPKNYVLNQWIPQETQKNLSNKNIQKKNSFRSKSDQTILQFNSKLLTQNLNPLTQNDATNNIDTQQDINKINQDEVLLIKRTKKKKNKKITLFEQKFTNQLIQKPYLIPKKVPQQEIQKFKYKMLSLLKFSDCQAQLHLENNFGNNNIQPINKEIQSQNKNANILLQNNKLLNIGYQKDSVLSKTIKNNNINNYLKNNKQHIIDQKDLVLFSSDDLE